MTGRLWLILSIGLIFISCSSKIYNQEQRVEKLISNLNWDSFGFTAGYVQKLALLSDAKEIIATRSKHKIDLLLKNITIPEKTVVIHAILTQLFEAKNGQLQREPHFIGTTIDFQTFTYNGLDWKYTIRNNEETFEVSAEQIKKISDYWLSKVKK